jgi:large subunit ribosomal protein L23
MKHNYYDLIRRPLITEKTTMLGEQNKYSFEVASNANKNSVKSAIEMIFGVKVSKVNIINIIGKVKRFKGRIGKQSDAKKAIVTLEKDHNIDLSGGIK